MAVDPPTTQRYALRVGLPVRNYEAEVSVTATAEGSEIAWGSTFDGVAGLGLVMRAFLGRAIRDVASRVAREAERRPSS